MPLMFKSFVDIEPPFVNTHVIWVCVVFFFGKILQYIFGTCGPKNLFWKNSYWIWLFAFRFIA